MLFQSKHLLFAVLSVIAVLALSVSSCGVGAMVENAERLDSTVNNFAPTKPRFRITKADTARASQAYEDLKRDYERIFDSLSRAGISDIEIGDKLPTNPDSSVYAEMMFIDDSHWPDSLIFGFKVYNHNGESFIDLAPPYLPESEVSRYWSGLSDISEDKECSENIVESNSFKIEEIRKNSAKNHAITYTLDYSGSMSGMQDIYEKLIRKMIISSREGDMFAFVPFAGNGYAAQELTYDLAKGKDMFKDRSFEDSIGSGSAIVDGIEKAILEASSAPDSLEKIIILLTDGFDFQSGYSQEATLAKAAASGIKIYTIGYGTGFDPQKLETYSEETGGRFYYITDPREFKFAFADIYLDLSAYYRVTYTPNPCRGRHEISINLTLPSLDNMSLEPKGYYSKSYLPAPKKEISVSYLDIIFESGSADISPESDGILRDVAAELSSANDINIEIIGHTDDVGTVEDNQVLSEERGKSVMERLISLGVPKSAIKYSGKGEEDPIASNKTEEGRRKNRRTEIKIEKK